MSTHWRNWSGGVEGRPRQVVSPASTAEVAAIVKAAEGEKVKARGSGHSFTSIAVTDGIQLDMSRLNQVTKVEGSLVTVQGGITIAKLNDELAARGLALENMGDIDQQTITGAISTGTHGTGAKFGSIATQVRALEVVTADGSIVTCSPTERPALFSAARVGLGALGIITSVTLQCVPAFALRCIEQPLPLDRILDGMDDFVDGYDHFEFYWFPHTNTGLTKQQKREPLDPAKLQPVGKLRGWFDDEFVTNTAFEALLRIGSAVPASIPTITRLVTKAITAREYADQSHRVLASRRNVRFNESEYAVPRADVVPVLKEIKSWVDSHDEPISFPLEIRFVKGDDIPLAPTYERDSAYIAFHQYHRMPYQRYFDALEDIFAEFEGRPHWGKLHRLNADDLRKRYPLFDEFVALRDELDPTDVFGNDYLDRVLGPRGDHR